MVGGKVIEVSECRSRPDVIFVDCADRPHGRIETCAILVEKNVDSQKIQIGDSVWWQGQFAMWTPQRNRQREEKDMKCGIDFDIKIPRVGFSGVTHPDRRTENNNA